ncbi:MAG: hypothetical protein JSR17_01030 [Proteobacteria bacterium]|nr:hypothetical protein [Pseudomonadota bacterium]
MSGGLDSSLVCAVSKSLLGKSFPVFTIAFESGSSDLPFAKEVANYLGLQHHIITITEEQALKEIDETIYAIESWDITTIRASVMQRLVAKYVERHTDIRVLLVGENSDELFLGYLYEHNAPSAAAAHEDSIRLVSDVHRFDGLRADRCMAYHGLEVRLPFADTNLLDFVFGLDPQFVIPQKGVEKALLRDAFADSGLLPHSVLSRVKGAMSDEVSSYDRSWYVVIQEYMDSKVSDEEFNKEKNKFKHCTPFTKESYYYRKKFVEYFGTSESVSKTIPYFWMPKWTLETQDPSARTLKKYKELIKN